MPVLEGESSFVICEIEIALRIEKMSGCSKFFLLSWSLDAICDYTSLRTCLSMDICLLHRRRILLSRSSCFFGEGVDVCSCVLIVGRRVFFCE